VVDDILKLSAQVAVLNPNPVNSNIRIATLRLEIEIKVLCSRAHPTLLANTALTGTQTLVVLLSCCIDDIRLKKERSYLEWGGAAVFATTLERGREPWKVMFTRLRRLDYCRIYVR
jgi:hypothetical protein